MVLDVLFNFSSIYVLTNKSFFHIASEPSNRVVIVNFEKMLKNFILDSLEISTVSPFEHRAWRLWFERLETLILRWFGVDDDFLTFALEPFCLRTWAAEMMAWMVRRNGGRMGRVGSGTVG